jgi:hypothetical protein
MIARIARVGSLVLALAAIGAGPFPLTRYDVTMTQTDAGPGSIRGTLDLQVSADGIITGFYRDFDGATRRPIAGGRGTGTTIWFDVGRLHVTGTLDATGIHGHAFRGSATEYDLEAIPSK